MIAPQELVQYERVDHVYALSVLAHQEVIHSPSLVTLSLFEPNIPPSVLPLLRIQ
jgi:hypothetical protein